MSKKWFSQRFFVNNRFTALGKELNSSHNGLSAPGESQWNETDSPGTAKLSSFDEIYRRSAFKAATSTAAWDILKVADMLDNVHLQGLSPSARHSALMMALEAAGVSVEDMLKDALQRQRVLNEHEAGQCRRLEDFQTAKQREKELLSAEFETLCTQYRTRIASAEQEIEQERGLFREWQERKEKEHRRISEAASLCAPSPGRLLPEETSSGSVEESGDTSPEELSLQVSSLSNRATPINGLDRLLGPVALGAGPGTDTPAALAKVPSAVSPPGQARRH